MDRVDSVLTQYGIEPKPEYREEIRNLLIEESLNENREDNEYLKTLCILLYTYGIVEDTLIIWKVKNIDYDTGCYIDGELLVGAGLEETITYLRRINTSESKEELDYLMTINFIGRQELLDFYRSYYGLK
jgi:hypothetical protein